MKFLRILMLMLISITAIAQKATYNSTEIQNKKSQIRILPFEVVGEKTQDYKAVPLDLLIAAPNVNVENKLDKTTGGRVRGIVGIDSRLDLKDTSKLTREGKVFLHTTNDISPSYNLFLGQEAGNLNFHHGPLAVAGGNIGIGYKAMQNVDSAGYSIGIGMFNLLNAKSIYSVTSVGVQGFLGCKKCTYSTGMGIDHGKFIDSAAFNNSLFGAKSGLNMKGNINNYFGVYSGENSNGDYNIGIGQQVLQNNIGGNNIAIGRQALKSNNASSNIGIGEVSGYNNTTGAAAIYIGPYSAFSNTTGDRNIRIGGYSGYLASTGSYNITMGYSSGYNNNGSNNTIIGYSSFSTSTIGARNTVLGYGALALGDFGDDNIAIGFQSGRNSYGGNKNVWIGSNAGTLYTVQQNNKLGIAQYSTELISGDFLTAQVGVNVKNDALTETLTVGGNGSFTNTSTNLLKLNRTGFGSFSTNVGVLVTGNTADQHFIPNQANSGFAFQTKDASNNTIHAFMMASDGKIGAGIAQPQYHFHVYGSGSQQINASSTDNTASVSVDGFLYGSFVNKKGAMYLTNQSATGAINLQTNTTNRMVIDGNGLVAIGTGIVNSSAALDIQSTTKGLKIPSMTTTQINAIPAPADGLLVYDITQKVLSVYVTGTGWLKFTGTAAL